MSKYYNKAQAKALNKSCAYLSTTVAKKKEFLLQFHDVYKFPAKTVKRNLKLYDSLIKACDTIMKSDLSQFI